jgi:hypothetical protein
LGGKSFETPAAAQWRERAAGGRLPCCLPSLALPAGSQDGSRWAFFENKAPCHSEVAMEALMERRDPRFGRLRNDFENSVPSRSDFVASEPRNSPPPIPLLPPTKHNSVPRFSTAEELPRREKVGGTLGTHPRTLRSPPCAHPGPWRSRCSSASWGASLAAKGPSSLSPRTAWRPGHDAQASASDAGFYSWLCWAGVCSRSVIPLPCRSIFCFGGCACLGR